MFEDKEYPMCFACGKKNPIGLKMTFKMDEKEYLLYRNNARTGWEEFYNADKNYRIFLNFLNNM